MAVGVAEAAEGPRRETDIHRQVTHSEPLCVQQKSDSVLNDSEVVSD